MVHVSFSLFASILPFICIVAVSTYDWRNLATFIVELVLTDRTQEMNSKEKLTRKELHHTDPLYQQCHKFVMNARARHEGRQGPPPLRGAVATATENR